MFITLKNPNGANDSAMEQVAVTSAGTPAPTRSIRKAACIACQAKKIRCTGRGRSCDRCKTRSIACIFPSISAKPRLGSTQGSARRGSDREEQIELEDGLIESENRDATKSPSSATDTNQHDPSDGGFTSSNILNYFNNENINFDLEALGRDSASISGNSTMAIANHMNIANDAHDARNALATPPSDPGQNTGDDSILWNGSPTPSCSCMQDAVRVIQQLDDDEFGITSLSLDQVLQLQKWMIAQCCKPIDCVNCVHLSAIHTVLLIIADRLTETFECLHRRIRRAAAGLSDHQSSLPNALTPSEIDEPTFPVDTRAQLFCNSSGIAASSSMCNNQLFSAEFRAQYSDEEQVHMIRVLLKLQIRNFRNLLSRIDSVNQITGSSARRSKIRALVGRLGKSNTDIEVALQAVLRTISGP